MNFFSENPIFATFGINENISGQNLDFSEIFWSSEEKFWAKVKCWPENEIEKTTWETPLLLNCPSG